LPFCGILGYKCTVLGWLKVKIIAILRLKFVKNLPHNKNPLYLQSNFEKHITFKY